MILNNIEIRKAIEKGRYRYHEVAEAIGIDPCTLSRWLQKELTGERKARVLDALRKLK